MAEETAPVEPAPEAPSAVPAAVVEAPVEAAAEPYVGFQKNYLPR